MNLAHNAVRFFLGISPPFTLATDGFGCSLLLIVVILTHHWKLALQLHQLFCPKRCLRFSWDKRMLSEETMWLILPKAQPPAMRCPLLRKWSVLPGERIRTYGQQIFCEDKASCGSEESLAQRGEPLPRKIQDQLLGEDDYFVLGNPSGLF